MKSEILPFSQALDLCKGGERIARAGWNGRGMYVYLKPGSMKPGADGSVPSYIGGVRSSLFEPTETDGAIRMPCLVLKAADGSIVEGWLASQTDLLACDWGVADVPQTAAAAEKRLVPREAAIEAELQAKGNTAPRLTPADIDGRIASTIYHIFPGTTLTVCALVLTNGFTVTGESAAASPENFDEKIGRQIAFDNARQKIWPLEGYLLRETLHSAA